MSQEEGLVLGAPGDVDVDPSGFLYEARPFSSARQIVVDIDQFTSAGYTCWQVAGGNVGTSLLWELSFWVEALNCGGSCYRAQLLKKGRLFRLAQYLGILDNAFFKPSREGIRDTVVCTHLLYMLILRRYYFLKVEDSVDCSALAQMLQRWGSLALEGLTRIECAMEVTICFHGSLVTLQLNGANGIVYPFDELMLGSTYSRQWTQWLAYECGDGIAAIRPTQRVDLFAVLGFVLTLSTSWHKLGRELESWIFVVLRWCSALVALGVESCACCQHLYEGYADQAASVSWPEPQGQEDRHQPSRKLD